MKMILQDGTIINNLLMNGNNFISKTEITEEMFSDNLRKVVIGGDNHNERDEVHHNLKLIQIQKQITQDANEFEWWFILAEKTKEELEKEELKQLIADLTETVLLGGM